MRIITSLLFMALLTAGCGDTTKVYFDSPTGPKATPAKVSSVQAYASNTSLKVGDSVFVLTQAVPTWDDPNFNKSVSVIVFSPAGVTAAHFSATGVYIIAKSVGTTEVNFCAQADSSFCTKVTFVVSATTATPTPVTTLSVSLIVWSGSAVFDTVKVGATKNNLTGLRVDVNQSNGSQRTLASNEWSQHVKFLSTNLAAISVDSTTGTVTGSNPGQGQVKACAKSQPTYCFVNPRVYVVIP